MASKLRLSAHPARQAEMRYRKKLSTSKGADKLRPIPNAIAPCKGRQELVGRAMRSNSRSKTGTGGGWRNGDGGDGGGGRGGWTEGVEKSARSRVDGREDCSSGVIRSGGVGGYQGFKARGTSCAFNGHARRSQRLLRSCPLLAAASFGARRCKGFLCPPAIIMGGASLA